MNVTEEQKKILLKYMRTNEDFARGRLRYNSANKKKLDGMWLSISTSLNSVGCGPRKEPKEWQKTWRDWKSAVLKKCAINRNHARGTGGGSPKVLKLTELEEDLLAAIDVESAGLVDIPEGGNFDRVMQKSCMPQQKIKKKILENIPSCQSIPLKRKYSLSEPEKDMITQTEIILPSGSGMRDDFYSQAQGAEDNIYLFDDESETEDIITHVVQHENTDPCRRNTPQADDLIGHAQEKNTTNRSRPTNVSAAVQLMRDQLKMKQDKLNFSKEGLSFKKEKLQFMKKATTKCLYTLTNIDKNLKLLREAVEKMAPSYLE